MRVVILAAGQGSRLKQGDLPKPLTMLTNGKTILGYQLEMLSKYLSLDRVLIVVGYHKEEILQRFSDLLYVYNPNYASENTSKSLLRALKKIDEDVLWLNGDVVFHPSVLELVLQTAKTGMIVNVGAVGEEEIKYNQNAQGQIIEVSKDVKNPLGEALGINYWAAEDLEVLRQNLALCDPQAYFEKAIEMSIQQGMAVWSLPVERSYCTEIDFPEDLVRANQLLKIWNQSPT